eukprot:scaffold63359_cov78-Phaeocystis_antarctica.AAC.4
MRQPPKPRSPKLRLGLDLPRQRDAQHACARVPATPEWARRARQCARLWPGHAPVMTVRAGDGQSDYGERQQPGPAAPVCHQKRDGGSAIGRVDAGPANAAILHEDTPVGKHLHLVGRIVLLPRQHREWCGEDRLEHIRADAVQEVQRCDHEDRSGVAHARARVDEHDGVLGFALRLALCDALCDRLLLRWLRPPGGEGGRATQAQASRREAEHSLCGSPEVGGGKRGHLRPSFESSSRHFFDSSPAVRVSWAVSQDCSSVSGTPGLHKEPASASYGITQTVLSGRGRLVSRSGKTNGKSAKWKPSTLRRAVL